jgi:hypothetical protein
MRTRNVQCEDAKGEAVHNRRMSLLKLLGDLNLMIGWSMLQAIRLQVRLAELGGRYIMRRILYIRSPRYIYVLRDVFVCEI